MRVGEGWKQAAGVPRAAGAVVLCTVSMGMG